MKAIQTKIPINRTKDYSLKIHHFTLIIHAVIIRTFTRLRFIVSILSEHVCQCQIHATSAPTGMALLIEIISHEIFFRPRESNKSLPDNAIENFREKKLLRIPASKE